MDGTLNDYVRVRCQSVILRHDTIETQSIKCTISGGDLHGLGPAGPPPTTPAGGISKTGVDGVRRQACSRPAARLASSSQPDKFV
jgi:hypothetical protein